VADAWKSGVDFDNVEIAYKFKNALINKTGNKKGRSKTGTRLKININVRLS